MSVVIKFWHFFSAFCLSVWAKWRGYEVLAPAPAQIIRYSTCLGCLKLDDDICTECGCLALAKTQLSMEKCPLGKWKRIFVAKQP